LRFREERSNRLRSRASPTLTNISTSLILLPLQKRDRRGRNNPNTLCAGAGPEAVGAVSGFSFMNDFQQVFEDALDGAAEIKGERETVTYRGKAFDALFYDTPSELMAIAGGNADNGQSTIAIRFSQVMQSGGEPFTGEPITIRGKQLSVISINRKESCFEITAGNPAAQD